MTYFVFVDFENVQKVDLALIENKPVHVTLLIGKSQTWLDLTLVQQIRRMPHQVELLEVGASGRNALDLTLAHYLGRAVERIPEANYAIVSKDKDFDPMVGHLTARGISIVRKDSFAALPFLLPPKPVAPPKIKPMLKVEPDLRAGFGHEQRSFEPSQPARRSGSTKPNPEPKAKHAPKAAPVAKPAKPADKLEKLIKHLRNSPPSSRRKLEHMIEAFYKASLPAGGVEGVIATLAKQKIVAVDDNGKVTVL